MRWSELMNFYDRAMSWEQREIEFTLNDFCDRPNLYYAAPDLLEALENCLGFVVAHPQFTEDLRNLIAKARGES